MSVFRRRLVWLALSLCPCASAAAQVARYNPYADA